MIELERTYLAKKIPEGMAASPSKEMVDIYIPESSAHPDLRIRKRGDKYEITRKRPIVDGDASRMEETTIVLNESEYLSLSKAPGKRVAKRRYRLAHEGHTYEVDVFNEALTGLVLVDIEFQTVDEKSAFSAPDFCLAEVTQEKFLAGGMLCGKKYEDVEKDLARFGYTKIAV